MALTPAGIFLVLSMFTFLVTVGVLVWFLWDKGRFMIVGEDLETGDTVYKKARAKDHGIPWKHGNYPNAYVHPQKGDVGTWHGLLYSRPKVTINARTGNVLQTRKTTYNEDKEAHEGEQVESSWPQLYYELIDSGAVKQALETQKSFWATHVGALVVANVILSFGLVAIITIFGGNA